MISMLLKHTTVHLLFTITDMRFSGIDPCWVLIPSLILLLVGNPFVPKSGTIVSDTLPSSIY